MAVTLPRRWAAAAYFAPLPVAALELALAVAEEKPPLLWTTAAAVSVAMLAVRRRYPALAFLAALPAGVHLTIGLVVAAYSVGRYAARLATVAGCCLVVTVIDACFDLSRLDHYDVFHVTQTVIYAMLANSAAFVLGRLVSSRITLHNKYIELKQAREETIGLRTRAALVRDRARLAAEMHDIVSHQMSLIAVHAGALEMTSDDPDARTAAATIRGLSVKTLDELRHVVGILRNSGLAEPGPLNPQPMVAQLPELVRESGLEVTVSGALPENLPAASQRVIYRMVQEAFTNVRKHAPGSRVVLEFGDSASEIVTVVRNTAGHGPNLGLPGGGHGLAGIRERADVLGGTLTARAEPGGGFRTELRIPYTRAESVRAAEI
ncbi:sensor histidine kinase [Nocardia inohanensis]|uniref:sensor histidine kinase n=1 Tax=Nocardia inohanensis TaxID=209246 RepID=UPI0008322507|nr:histidine kinase [Nocardia inohanensis]